ncbi:MAG: hypothetical protein ACREI9_16565, partial [Nitrospiraceae bacterium]
MAAAQAEADDIEELADNGGLRGAELRVHRLVREVVISRIAQANGHLNGAICHFESAAKLEDRLDYMEPPYWYTAMPKESRS